MPAQNLEDSRNQKKKWTSSNKKRVPTIPLKWSNCFTLIKKWYLKISWNFKSNSSIIKKCWKSREIYLKNVNESLETWGIFIWISSIHTLNKTKGHFQFPYDNIFYSDWCGGSKLEYVLLEAMSCSRMRGYHTDPAPSASEMSSLMPDERRRSPSPMEMM